MKTILIFTCLLISSVFVYSQQGSDYFYQEPIVEFTYDAIPLDSLNNQITSEMFKRRDLFVDIAEYEGKLANIVLTKNAPTIDSLENEPYLDSLFYNFDGTDGYEYFQIGSLEDFLISLDSAGIDSNFSFLNFFKSLQDWYSVYRYSATVNEGYTLLTVDTLVAGFNIRFEYLGERFTDETVNTVKGSFECKKFLISFKVSLILPPLPPLELLSTKDTVWIVPVDDFWMVQDIVPTNHIDLSLLGIPPFSIPGLTTIIVDTLRIIANVDDGQSTPTSYQLSQNYPNPFNPSTTIIYSIKNDGIVNLIVYDIQGNELATLVNSEKPSGVYEIEWNASNLPSGIYFYQLKTKEYIDTKKMLLLK